MPETGGNFVWVGMSEYTTSTPNLSSSASGAQHPNPTQQQAESQLHSQFASPTQKHADSTLQSQSQSEQQQQQQALAAQQGLASQHKRVYQACIPCRRRKVRCDLGSVDDPHEPPCVRCRRESKECFFSATRRKRKTEDGEGSDVDEYTVRNGRKRFQPDDAPPAIRIEHRSYTAETPLTPGGSHGRSQPLRRPDGSIRSNSEREPRDEEMQEEGDGNAQLENLEAQSVMRRGMYGPHDALDLLYKAATDRFVGASSDSLRIANADSPVTNHSNHRREESTASVMSVAPSAPPLVQSEARRASRPTTGQVKVEQQPIDPELTRPALSTQPGYEEALRTWSRFRFVRAGWFTAQEAIEYVD